GPAEDPAELRLEGVTRARGHGRARRIVLADLTTCFAPGAVTAVTGPSGSGKTTLLELLAGLDCADRGRVLLDGVELGRLGAEARAALRRRRIGYLTQAPAPVGFLSATENVVLALRIRGVAERPAGARAAAILDGLGLGERARQRVARLSAGEAQRVALAAALACTRGLLLADEPTSRLDRRAAVLVARTLSAAAAAGHTVICATHDEELIGACSHRLRLEAQAVGGTAAPTPAPRS
ncbi:MAG TPA: ATP-binding cassette domain-containing protein, partial [Solirubrobacteraceae bacterium]